MGGGSGETSRASKTLSETPSKEKRKKRDLAEEGRGGRKRRGVVLPRLDIARKLAVPFVGSLGPPPPQAAGILLIGSLGYLVPPAT